MQNWLTAHRLDSITDTLRKRLRPKRCEHAFGVAHAALGLSQRWGVDPFRALAAGLLHDIAKEMPKPEMRALIELEWGGMPEEYDGYPNLWHALAGEVIAKEEFGLPCNDVGRAIRHHPTGEGNMTPLEQIIFLADYTAPGRDWNGVGELRDLAMRDLRSAADRAILIKTDYLLAKGRELNSSSLRAREDVLSRQATLASETT